VNTHPVGAACVATDKLGRRFMTATLTRLCGRFVRGAEHIPAFESFAASTENLESENPHMTLFDVAALLLTHYQSCTD
jgi:hypothetical protein